MEEIKKTVLAVDDEPTTLDIIVQVVTEMGYQVETAKNGRVALDLIRDHRPDLVLTDIFMPQMNGLELLREIRLFDQKLPVILITGFDTEDAYRAVKSYKANGLILKPFQIPILQKAIRYNLESTSS